MVVGAATRKRDGGHVKRGWPERVGNQLYRALAADSERLAQFPIVPPGTQNAPRRQR